MKKFMVLFVFTITMINVFPNNLKPLYVETKNRGGLKFLNSPILDNIAFVDNSEKTIIYKNLTIHIDNSFDHTIFENLNIRNFPDGKGIISLSKGCGNFGTFKSSMYSYDKGFVILFNKSNNILFEQIKPNFDFAYPLITHLIFPNKQTFSILIFDKLYTYNIEKNKFVFKNKSLLPLPNIRFPIHKLYINDNLLVVLNLTFTKYNKKIPLIFTYKFSNNSFKFDNSILFDKDLTKQIAGILWRINNNKIQLDTLKRNKLISEAAENYFINGFEQGEFYFLNQINQLLVKGNWKSGKIISHTALKRLSHLSIVQFLKNSYTNEIFILLKSIKGKQKIVVLSSNMEYKKTYVVNNKIKDNYIYIQRIKFIDKNNAFLGVYENTKNKKGKHKIIKAKFVY